MKNKAHIQPVVFSDRNRYRKRRYRLSQREFFLIRLGLGVVLTLTIYFWSR